MKVYSRLCPGVVINYLKKKNAAALGGSGNCGDSLAKGKLIRMGRGECALELLCVVGEGLPWCCSLCCAGDLLSPH